MCEPVTLGLLATSIIGAGVSAYQGNKASGDQEAAQKQAAKAAAATQEQQTEDTNRANSKTPDVNAIVAANTAAARGGASSTMLTGPSGVDPSQLNLGKTTLLGGN